MLADILEVGDGLVELQAIDGGGGLVCVLERDAQVGASRSRRLCIADGCCAVSDLKIRPGVSSWTGMRAVIDALSEGA